MPGRYIRRHFRPTVVTKPKGTGQQTMSTVLPATACFGCDSEPMYVGFGTATADADNSSFVMPRDGFIRSFFAKIFIVVACDWQTDDIDRFVSAAISVPDLRRIVADYARFEIRLTIKRLPDVDLACVRADKSTTASLTDLAVVVTAGDRIVLMVDATDACVCNLSCGIGFD